MWIVYVILSPLLASVVETLYFVSCYIEGLTSPWVVHFVIRISFLLPCLQDLPPFFCSKPRPQVLGGAPSAFVGNIRFQGVDCIDFLLVI